MASPQLRMADERERFHNIKMLRSLAEQIEPDLIAVWSRATKPDRRLFTLLQSAYIEARYSVHYAITAEELAWLSGRAEILRALVERRLQGRIAQLRKDAAAGASLSSVHG